MSKIEWTGRTWNPVTGCSLVSPGCTNCYAMRMAARLEAMGQTKYAGTTRKVNRLAVWTGKINLDDKALGIPLAVKRPTTWFVNSMSDLFHEGVPFDFIDRVFAVMALTPQHTYQILTKRPERMAEYLADGAPSRGPAPDGSRRRSVVLAMHKFNAPPAPQEWRDRSAAVHYGIGYEEIWPLPNVWLGCSPVNQATLEQYLPYLLRCDAAVRFLSLEPLLGSIRLPHRIWCRHHRCYEPTLCMDESKPCFRWQAMTTDMLDWVIVGGESGQNARPMHPDWARSIRDQCQATGVKFFFKQWGAWKPADEVSAEQIVLRFKGDDGVPPKRTGPENPEWHTWPDGWKSALVGKKAAGRELDGREWNEMPKAAEVTR